MLAAVYASADVFVHTNDREPFGIAPLEAMAAGVPVVAFAGTGGGARLAGTVAGRAVPSFDVEAYAEAVEALLDDQEARRATGALAARTVDDRYSFEAYAGRLLGMLAEVSVDIIDQCTAMGVPFAREYGGTLANRSFGGAQVSRTFYAKGQTGQQLLIGAYSGLSRQIQAGNADELPRLSRPRPVSELHRLLGVNA